MQKDLGNFSRSDFSNTPRITKTVNIESKRHFRAAGVYAIPGQTVKVTRLDEAELTTKIYMSSVRDGATHLYAKNGYKRPRYLQSTYLEIEPGETVEFTSAIGGPIQIRFSANDLMTQFKFENVGQWKRAWYYPINNESMDEAVQRESKAARESAGILDASTLGKIDIQGTDASEFLNRVYTNAWTKLGIGKCRYGLMLNEDGMVYDDGVTTRLDENHYIMTTTTGGAANVMGKLEDFLQTEWPELDVFLTSITDHFATVSVCGPNSRKILNKINLNCVTA